MCHVQKMNAWESCFVVHTGQDVDVVETTNAGKPTPPTSLAEVGQRLAELRIDYYTPWCSGGDDALEGFPYLDHSEGVLVPLLNEFARWLRGQYQVEERPGSIVLRPISEELCMSIRLVEGAATTREQLRDEVRRCIDYLEGPVLDQINSDFTIEGYVESSKQTGRNEASPTAIA